MGTFKILRPPEYGWFAHDDLVVFLAGPIQGAPDWHDSLITKLEKFYAENDFKKSLAIASPKRSFIEDIKEIDYIEQVNWEGFHLNKANEQGILVFWMPVVATPSNNRSYAQTTRFELGEWYGKNMQNFVIGAEEGFHGAKYLKLKFFQKYSYTVNESEESFFAELKEKLYRDLHN